MKVSALILLVLLGISCGGMRLETKTKSLKNEAAHSPMSQNIEKLGHLKILEQKYIQDGNHMNLAITRGMILKMEGETGDTAVQFSASDLKELRKNQSFLSLEMTIEHLSHREQFKLGTRHSAFHKRP